MDRQTRKQDIEHAYDLQARAAVAGAARFTTIGIGLAVLGHYTWPTFRRQTLPFKGFLVSVFTIFGLVIGAENALLSHEAERRQTESVLRKQARIELARRGLVATETEIAKWKAERLAAAQHDQSTPTPRS
ncbi:hypothetical protein POSPLADRAFT_1048534 [Postia placenta MAD-698-R-SB12]|uniref:HIG1 domain-containing protein n=1 Tax=Postia placenta MAD-698-R-SB12 TaxID=670580 RepID=A0A1X6MS33_9APHY|nr:hypothetical protein POSPLADRAFT_1048534 [Postia placenta MAD-698-R-SB12]OSX59185.1 hypothetical protein POSPLADRAFT_1048534 [Postia placenta MAD-698-R-SB12]